MVRTADPTRTTDINGTENLSSLYPTSETGICKFLPCLRSEAKLPDSSTEAVGEFSFCFDCILAAS